MDKLHPIPLEDRSHSSTPANCVEDAVYHEQSKEAVLDRWIDSLCHCTLIINNQLNIAHKFDAPRNYFASQEQQSLWSLKDILPSDLVSSLTSAVQHALETGETDLINVVYANKTQHDTNLSIQIKPLVLEDSSPTYVAIMIKNQSAAIKPATNIQEAYQNLTDYLHTVEQTLNSFQSSTLAQINELEQANQALRFHNRQLLSSNEELQRMNQNMQTINTQLMTTLTTARDLLIELGWDGKLLL